MAASIGQLIFTTKLDKSGLSRGLNELKGVKASIGVSLDFDDRSMARMEQRLAGMKLDLKVTVDNRALVNLDAHLNLLNGGAGQPTTNKFNGGQSAIDQYVEFQKQQQAARARG
jgi:hypothetical protein